MRKITPCLWFDHQAEEAANYYVSIFQNSAILETTRYGEAGAGASGKTEGSVMTVKFQLEGAEFLALNGGPEFPFTEAISLMVDCETQEEIDRLWGKLIDGGEEGQCGWLKDKFGVSWQVVPTILNEMLRDPDREKVERITNAFLKMRKFDIAELKKAYQGKMAA